MILYLLFLTFSGLPVFFKQKRIGMNGKLFTIYKFRTMVVNAAKMQKKGKSINSLTTRIGKIIRPIHLDELPQLWNIFIGNMSFIGYRPILKENYKKEIKTNSDLKKVYKIRPGFTGLMSDLSYIDEKTRKKILTKYKLLTPQKKTHTLRHRANLFYAKKMNFLLDVKIIWWTFLLEIQHFFKIFKP